jgi:DNA-binding winged helix-turn-helix (wHTH) protein/tetratricopeptide (TPR) repeat protein
MRTRREHCFVFGPFRLEPEEGRLLRDGLLVPLTPKAFAMLLVLVSHSGRLVDKDVLMQELWPDAFVEEGNLTFTMSVLRKALGDSARTARYIETVPKRGYRFIAPVREIDVKNPVKSVAVLPFLNLGSAEGSEYLAAGIHDALIDELARNGSLHVISRTSSMGATRPLAAFARALQLDAVVEGSALLEGDRVHIRVSLTDPLDDEPMWTQSYERSLRDVVSWQSEVARTIAQQMDATPAPRGYAAPGQDRAVAPEAHAAYLRGRYYWHQSFTASAFRSAIRHFRQALDLDAGYAPAWSGLANCFSAMAVQAMLPPEQGLSQAKHAAERALALEPSLAEVHVSMAAVQLFFEWNWASTERALQSAVDLSPSYSPAHALFAHYAAARGWTHYAIASARRALDLDPMSPVAHLDQAWAYLLARDYPRALNQCDSIQAMGMNVPLARVYVAQIYQCMGKHETAVTEMEKVLASDGDTPAPILAMLGHAYGLAGRTRAAREALQQMKKLASRCYVSSYDWAVLHTGLGENDVALRYLRQALKERSPRAIWLNVEPAFDSLRADRRFQNIIRRLGLE